MNKEINLGVMGQVNSGKKTLIKAINSLQDNNYKYINFEIDKELMNKNIDAIVLVVDTLEGTTSKTREHILYAKQLGIENIVVFINKCDIENNQELINNIKYQVMDLLFAYGHDVENIAIFTGSALKALEGKKEYTEKVIELINKINEITQDKKKIRS